MRKDAREAVYTLLYSYYLTGKIDGDLKNECYKERKLNERDVEFAEKLIDAVIEHERELAEKIDNLSVSYKLDRINYLDKAAIEISMAEISYFDDIDAAVSVDEAVRLVKKYSTENSLGFVNGILAAYIRRVNR